MNYTAFGDVTGCATAATRAVCIETLFSDMTFPSSFYFSNLILCELYANDKVKLPVLINNNKWIRSCCTCVKWYGVESTFCANVDRVDCVVFVYYYAAIYVDALLKCLHVGVGFKFAPRPSD